MLFDALLDKQAIERQLSSIYTQQNGFVERDNRTITESARSMIHAAGVPLTLWAEAINTATYVLNRTSNSQVCNSTPYGLWHEIKPKVHHYRIFGTGFLAL